MAALAIPTTISAQSSGRPPFEPVPLDGRSPFQRPFDDSEAVVRVMIDLSLPSIAERRGDAIENGGDLAPFTEFVARATIERQQDSIEQAIDVFGGGVEQQLADAANVLVASVPRSAVGRIASLRGVDGVQVARVLRQTNTASNAATGADRVWDDFGLTGVDQVIAIIDDGVDYTHATFGGSGDSADYESNDRLVIEPGSFPTAKVVGGYDFVGDEFDAEVEGSTPVPDPDPLPCGDHGTHVAGTAAGYGVNADGTTFDGEYSIDTVAGLKVGPGSAPEARILAYKVFSCAGSTDDATILAAIDQAVADGADVINLSLGSDYGTSGSIDALAIDNAVRAGVMVVASAGNAGHAPYIVGTPSTSDRALSVAALDTSFAEFDGAELGESGVLGINANVADLSAGVTGVVRVLMNGDAISEGCAEADYEAVEPGDIVVVVRGVCGRVEKAVNGQAAGAGAVVMVNNDVSLPPFEGVVPDLTIPFIGVSSEAVDEIVAIDGATITIGVGDPIPNDAYGLATSFSSGGPRSGDSALKPEIIAPGEAVESALFGSGSDGVRLGGTSMSSPHTAGIAALVRQAHPEWEPAKVKAALMGSADRTGSDYAPLIHGAGMVDAASAIATQTGIITDDGLNSLSFGYVESTGAISVSRTMEVFNDSDVAVDFELTSEFSGDSGGATISIEPETVTVEPSDTAPVVVTIAMGAETVVGLPGVPAYVAELLTVTGNVIATPTTPDVDEAHIPFALVPRAVSTVTATGIIDHIVVANDVGHHGPVDVYSWGIAGDDNSEISPFDIRAAGVQQFDIPADPDDPESATDTSLVFAVALHEPFSNPGQLEVDVLIDTNEDGEPDILVASIDEGLFFAGAASGTAITVTLDLATNELLGEPFITFAPMNSTVLLLPTLASTIGATSFTYEVGVLDQISEEGDLGANAAAWDTLAPPVSTGDFIELDPGTIDYLHPVKYLDSPAYESTLGWLVVMLDNAAGVTQATTIALDQV